MSNRIDQTLAGFDESVLERWGLKPTAKDTLNRAKERGAITPKEISEMISTALAKDRQKMTGVMQEIKKILQNLNITVTFNVVHIPTSSNPLLQLPIQLPRQNPKTKPEGLAVFYVANATESKPAPQQAGEGHESPFLNAKILQEHGLKPEALGILLVAREKGHISPQQIGSIICAEISQDSEKLRPTMRWITQLLGVINVKIVIGEIHYKKPESHSPETSYSRRPESPSSNRGKLNTILFNSTGLSEKTSEEPSEEDLLEMEENVETDTDENEFADPNGEFVPKFIFDRESGVTNPYYRAVKDHKFLKHQDLLELARRWHMHGDYEARNTIVYHNQRLSMKIAGHYMGRGLDYDDLVQEGNIGLMVAVERFDPEKGFHFTTYATWWVRQHMTRAIQNFKDTVRMSVHAQEALSKMLKVTCELAAELRREPTLEEVAAKTGKDVDKVRKILHQLKIPIMSLEELAYSSSSKNSDATIGDMIVDNCFFSPVTALEAKEELEKAALTIRTLLASIKALPIKERMKTAFKMYYGLEGHPEGATLDSIGQTSGFGVTRERIRQMHTKVWKTLAEYGISMNDKKLVAALKRVHDLENIVGNEADLSTPTEAMILQEISTTFQNPNGDDDEIVPADSITISRHPKVNLEKVELGTLTIENIIRVVGEAYGVTPEIILGDSKPKEVVWVRWVCTYIMRNELRSTFVEIGQILHYTDHTSVMYGYRLIKKAIEEDPSVKEKIEKIIVLCGFQDEKPVELQNL